jgi:hypothetical protein
MDLQHAWLDEKSDAPKTRSKRNDAAGNKK